MDYESEDEIFLTELRMRLDQQNRFDTQKRENKNQLNCDGRNKSNKLQIGRNIDHFA